MIELRQPSIALLPRYAAALRKGWSPNTVRDVSGEQLALIEAGAETFLAELLRQDGTIKLPDDVKMVMPGDNVLMSVELITPVAIEAQQRFAIREGGRTVGAGVITKIVE